MFPRTTLISFSFAFILASASGLYAEKLMASEDVATAQRLLHARGFDPGLITGTVTPATSHAVRQFQSKNHLGMNGKFDAPTQAALGVIIRIVESDPVLGVTQEAREAAIRGTKGTEEIIRAKPSEPKK